MTQGMLQSEQVEEAIKAALRQLKRINILVNGKISLCDTDHMILWLL